MLDRAERAVGVLCVVFGGLGVFADHVRLWPAHATTYNRPHSTPGVSTTLINTKEPFDIPRTFSFDHSFWSHNPDDAHFVNQEQVYGTLGASLIDDVFMGYNSCVFAYGK